MDVDFLIDRLEKYVLEECPKFLGNRMVNEGEIRGHIAQLRQAVPEEVEQARKVVQESDAILEAAHQRSEVILEEAREEGERLASSHQFVVDAQRQAKMIVQEARQTSDRLRADADDYAFNALSQLQAELARLLHVVENGLHRLEVDHESSLSEKKV